MIEVSIYTVFCMTTKLPDSPLFGKVLYAFDYAHKDTTRMKEEATPKDSKPSETSKSTAKETKKSA